jgi:hypothetical protein
MLVSCTGLLIPGETPLTAHCIGGWIGPRTVPDASERRKVFGYEMRTAHAALFFHSLGAPVLAS